MSHGMSRRENALYHQIHPVKLGVDWTCSIVALFPMWDHRLVFALVIAFVPSFLTSFLVIRLADLTRYKHSAFGRYMASHMSATMKALRMIGFVLMMVAAWYHDLLLIALGLAVILLAWLNGYFSSVFRDMNRQ